MSNFSFLEYSFDPTSLDPEEIYTALNRLGFVQRNLHVSNEFSMWTQNQCIVLLREMESAPVPKVSGMGIVIDSNEPFADAYYDEDCGMYVTHDPSGFRILSMPEKNLAKMISHGYQIIDKKIYDTTGLEYFSGLVYNSFSTELVNFYEGLGFKLTKSSERYATLVSKNNRFSLLLNKEDSSNLIDVVFADTHDVFKTTSCFTVAGFNKKEYIIDKSSLNFGPQLNHKIIGYNCLSAGNKNSYTIENSFREPLPSIDLVFRTRKQYLHFEEEVVETHYAAQ